MNERLAESGQPTVLIAGTGALAGLFAARLSASGVPVTMLGTWPAGLAALRRHGIRLVEGNIERAFPVSVAEVPEPSAGMRFALVLVKTWQTERAAVQLKEYLAEDGLALTLQNGLGNAEILSRVLGAQRVAAGVTTTGASTVAPGVVRAGGEGVISLGKHDRIRPLQEILQTAGFQVRMISDLDSLLWGKLVINAAINPLTALLEVPNGGLLEDPAAHLMMRRAAREVARVAKGLQIDLPFADPVQAAEEVAQRTATNLSSMLQDIRRGAPTEINAICGAVVRAAGQAVLTAPFNQTLWEMVQEKVRGIGNPRSYR